MRDDQRQRLLELQEKLADRFLLEADPGEWAGAGKAPRDMTQQERGDSYWMKKNAMATGGVLRFVNDALAKVPPAGGDGAEGEDETDMDRVVKEAEQRAGKLVKAAIARASAKSADAGTHGNAKG